MANLKPVPAAREFDLSRDSLRQLNLYLHKQAVADGISQIQVQNPDGAHSIACGLDADLDVHVHGHVGYYVAGMNQLASVTVHGNAGPGAARRARRADRADDAQGHGARRRQAPLRAQRRSHRVAVTEARTVRAAAEFG